MSEEAGKIGGLQVLIVGSGKLAGELLENLKSSRIDRVLPWSRRDASWKGCTVVVHAGSGHIGGILGGAYWGRFKLLNLNYDSDIYA